MPDNRSVDQLSTEELEAIVAQRKRIERAQRFAEAPSGGRFRPVTVKQADEPVAAKEPRKLKPTKSFRDRVLFAVEVVAVVGLLLIIVGSLSNLQTLNQEAVERVRTGTPNGSSDSAAADGSGAQVLPGSSFPPSNPLLELPGSSFAPEPVPPALGVRLQAVAALPIPTPGPRSPTRIVIPTVNIDWPVVAGDSWEELKQGVGHRVGSANPGEKGNLILSGHNDVYGEPFRDLEKLEVGKDVLIYAGGASFRYVIKARRVVVPTDLTVIAPSKNSIITLITCTPYRVDSHRLVLIGELTP